MSVSKTSSDVKFEHAGAWAAGLFAVALVLRLINLDGQLWADELLSLVRYVRKDLSDLFLHFYSNNQHPLYSLMARAWMDLVGESQWALRFPAALLGTACVPALYLLGLRVTSPRESIASAALLTVSYHHIWFSQNGRGYTAIMLAAILGTYFLLRGLDEQRPRFFVLYGLSAGLGAYTHLGMVLCVVGQAAFLVPWLLLKVRPARLWIWPVAAFPLGAAFTLLFHAPMLIEVIDFFQNKPSPAVGLATPLWALLDTVASLAEGFGGGLVAIGGLVVVLIGSVGLIGLISYARSNPVALGLFLGPIFITGLGVMGGRGIVYPRFFFGVAAFGILVFLRGAFVAGAWLSRRLGKSEARNPVGVGLVGALVLASALSAPINYLRPKQDFEGAIAHLEKSVGPNDGVASLGLSFVIYQGYFDKDWPQVWSPDEIRSAAQGHENLWLSFMMPEYIEHVSPEVMAFVRAHCKDMKGFSGTLRGGTVYTCRMPVTDALSNAES